MSRPTAHSPLLFLLRCTPPPSNHNDNTQSRADDLADARAADTQTSADRAAREAVVRRLDNERQYLKNQLQSEITCRNELREALATATRQLGEIKVKSSLPVRSKKAIPEEA